MIRWLIETTARVGQARRLIGRALIQPPRSEFAVPKGLANQIERTEDVQGWPMVTLAPKQPDPDHHLVFVHGGGYSIQGGAHHWWVVEELLKRTARKVTWVEYPLAPEHTHEDAHPVVLEALSRVLERSGQVTVLADSAGAGMVLALTQVLRDRAEPLPRQLVLLSPWVDIELANPEVAEMLDRDVLSNLDALREAGATFAADLSVTDPTVSPINGSMEGLPEMAVYAGTSEAFLPDIRRLRYALEQAGVPHHYREFEGMQHTWFMFPVPESHALMDDVQAFLERA